MTEAEAIAVVVPALLKAEGKAVLVEHQGNPIHLVAIVAAAMASHGRHGSFLVAHAARPTPDGLNALQGLPGLVGATDGHAKRGAWSDSPEKVLGIKPGIEPKLVLVVVLAAHTMAPAARGALANAARLVATQPAVVVDGGDWVIVNQDRDISFLGKCGYACVPFAGQLLQQVRRCRN